MEVSKWLVSWFITYLRDLQPTYIGVITQLLIPKDPIGMSCPKGIGITPIFLLFSDGIGTRNILFDREGSGFLGYTPEKLGAGP